MRLDAAHSLAILAVAVLAGACTGGATTLPDSGPEPAGAGDAAPDPTLQSGPMLQEFSIGGDFTLTDQQGRRFDLAQQRGRVFLMFFGYTACPDFCPATLARLAEAYDLLGDAGSTVTTLFVTVDPQHDTPEQLGSYLELFGIPALGLTGDDDELQDVAARYAARSEPAESDSGDVSLIAHTTYVYLIDGAGKVRYTFLNTDTAGFIAAGITQLLQESLDADPGGI